MGLFETVSDGIKKAMLAKDKVHLETLRDIKKEFLERAEATVIEEFLPKALSNEELTEALKAIIAQVGATSAKEMGKVLGVASKQLAGRADARAILAIVKELLAK
jgi:Uncharacterized conserved protein